MRTGRWMLDAMGYSPTRGGSKRVLCIDDDPQIGAAVARLLHPAGYRVITARGGSEGLRLALRERPDLILLDIRLPDLNGYSVLRALRDSGYAKPILFLTGLVHIEDIERGYREGGDYYLTKPFRNLQVLHIVDYLIGDLSPSQKQALELQI